MREGVAPISAKGFYDHFANGEHGQRMYDDVNFIRGIEIVSEIDKLIAANDDHISRCARGSKGLVVMRCFGWKFRGITQHIVSLDLFLCLLWYNGVLDLHIVGPAVIQNSCRRCASTTEEEYHTLVLDVRRSFGGRTWPACFIPPVASTRKVLPECGHLENQGAGSEGELLRQEGDPTRTKKGALGVGFPGERRRSVRLRNTYTGFRNVLVPHLRPRILWALLYVVAVASRHSSLGLHQAPVPPTSWSHGKYSSRSIVCVRVLAIPSLSRCDIVSSWVVSPQKYGKQTEVKAVQLHAAGGTRVRDTPTAELDEIV